MSASTSVLIGSEWGTLPSIAKREIFTGPWSFQGCERSRHTSLRPINFTCLASLRTVSALSAIRSSSIQISCLVIFILVPRKKQQTAVAHGRVAAALRAAKANETRAPTTSLEAARRLRRDCHQRKLCGRHQHDLIGRRVGYIANVHK